jgi:hypothetical protein
MGVVRVAVGIAVLVGLGAVLVAVCVTDGGLIAELTNLSFRMPEKAPESKLLRLLPPTPHLGGASVDRLLAGPGSGLGARNQSGCFRPASAWDFPIRMANWQIRRSH